MLWFALATAMAQSGPISSSSDRADQSSNRLRFVRSFSSAQDIEGSLHPVLDKTVDIVAGPADPLVHVDSLQRPTAVIADSNQHVFVADPGGKEVHIFDFGRSKYGILDAGGERISSPVGFALDAEDNLYITDANSRTILVYNAAGKFRREIGLLRGGESYFDDPAGLAIDRGTGTLYICDTRRHMVIAMDSKGHLVGRFGKRGGGDTPGDFQFPTQPIIAGGELYVLDSGNHRIQVLTLTGHFVRSISIVYSDRNMGFAVDRDLNLYVADPVTRVLQVFNHDGQPLYTFDPTTHPEGEFSRPTGLWVSANNCLYVVDSGNRKRIDVFEILGKETAHCR